MHTVFIKVEVRWTITPFGLFEFLCMPFGLKNAAQAFQRLMDQVCRGLEEVFVYIDDILIASSNASEHKRHLRQLFQRCNTVWSSMQQSAPLG